jgi:hypothetical protein
VPCIRAGYEGMWRRPRDGVVLPPFGASFSWGSPCSRAGGGVLAMQNLHASLSSCGGHRHRREKKLQWSWMTCPLTSYWPRRGLDPVTHLTVGDFNDSFYEKTRPRFALYLSYTATEIILKASSKADRSPPLTAYHCAEDNGSARHGFSLFPDRFLRNSAR